MESYEEKLEVLSAHKRVVQESTKATRFILFHLFFKSLNETKGLSF